MCTGPECNRTARHRTPAVLCGAHYLQWWRGVPLSPIQKKRRVRDGFKQCSRCEIELPIAQFNRQSTTKIQSTCKACTSIYARARKYGLTFDAMKALLEHPCSACGAEVNGREQHVDHCHDTGQVRGVLCHNCNTVLTVHMTPVILRRLAGYLEGNQPLP